jgi:hypothetical protein
LFVKRLVFCFALTDCCADPGTGKSCWVADA